MEINKSIIKEDHDLKIKDEKVNEEKQ